MCYKTGRNNTQSIIDCFYYYYYYYFTGAYCVEEMSVMMACWKRNDFNQQRCSQELSDFHNCVIAAQVSEKSHSVIVNEMGLLLFFAIVIM